MRYTKRQRKGSLGLNRQESPKFNFLKAVSIPATPCLEKRKEKKMFLSLYRTIKKEEKFRMPKMEKSLGFIEEIKKDRGLIIEGLIPVPIADRVSSRSLNRKPKSSLGLQMSRITVNIHSRKHSPLAYHIDEFL